MKKIKFNQYFFDDIDNTNKAYWLGFFLICGNTNNRLIRLNFHACDELHLSKFLKDINSNHEIEHVGNEYIRVTINNQRIVDQLRDKGILPNNKFIFSISEKYETDYWRGVIDGAGSLNSHHRSIQLYATEEICLKFSDFCKKYIKTKSNIIKAKSKNLWSFRLHGDIAYKISNILYSNSIISLDRKYQEYVKWKHLHATKPNFPRVLKFFHESLPEKFYTRRCTLPGNLEGECRHSDGIYYIRISNKLNDNEAINCLLHELAHIGTMHKQVNPHGSSFGINYSKIYRLYEREFT